ncbi:MAG TPA: histidine ammonia-lyase [Thermoplasmata archaeon]|nr:histidine ammonia-lyase [Thermoplasmata archaeon]
MTETLPLDGSSLTLDQFLAVVRGRCGVALVPAAREAIRGARGVVERAVASERPIYGVTTGFGRLADVRVQAPATEALQLNLIRSHASGAGSPLPEELVRGMMLLRVNTFARGLSGVRPELVDVLIECLNRGIYPFVPEQGSVGASGDLAPLAHLALALIGEGECIDPHGVRRVSAEILVANGIRPAVLVAKEGVALINGTSLMTSYLALAVADARNLLAAAEDAIALAWDALRGSMEPLDDRLGVARNLPEQRAVAERLRRRLNGSELAFRASTGQPQDPYTLRCAPQVLAATELAVGFAERVAATELNAVSDNPLVFPGDEFVSGGNFHGQPLALALDTLALGVQYLAGYSERRVARLLNPATNRGLPAFLASDPGLTSGFMIAQYLQAAIVAENVVLAHPASAMSLPTSADQEDFNSQGAAAGAKLRRLITNVERVIAVEWLVAGQALEARRPTAGGAGSERALRALRGLVPPLSTDRPLAGDIDRVAAALHDGSLVRQSALNG